MPSRARSALSFGEITLAPVCRQHDQAYASPVTDDLGQSELRLIGAIERIISVTSRSPRAAAQGPDAADDAIDMIEQVRAEAPDGSTRRRSYDRLLERLSGLEYRQLALRAIAVASGVARALSLAGGAEVRPRLLAAGPIRVGRSPRTRPSARTSR